MATLLRPRPQRLRFHAVSILPCSQPCAPVQALRGVRLLSLEAPRLPLVGCSNADGCDCRFQHHADRRAGPRRSDLRSATGQWKIDNRRRSLGRRDSDYADD